MYLIENEPYSQMAQIVQRLTKHVQLYMNPFMDYGFLGG